MKLLVILAVVVLLSLVGVLSIRAQQSSRKESKDVAAQSEVTVAQVLESYVKALGGKPALEKIDSRMSKGSVQVLGMDGNGVIEIAQKAPNKMAYMVRMPGSSGSYEGFNGKTAWVMSLDDNKPSEKKGSELEITRLRSNFYEPLLLTEHYPTMVMKGPKKINYRDGERMAYMIEAKPTKGGKETLFFDKESSFLIRHDFETDSPAGKLAVRRYYLDYKELDGVFVPFTIRQVQDQLVMIFRFSEIKQNLALDDSLFDKPGH